MATTTEFAKEAYNPFAGPQGATHTKTPLFALNYRVRFATMSTQSFTISHLAYKSNTSTFIDALRVSELPSSNVSDMLSITASEKLLQRVPGLLEHDDSTDDESQLPKT